jgi:hypothetical protein
MAKTRHVVSWNCRRAAAEHPLWDYFEGLAPDIAMPQEVRSLPVRVLESFDVRLARPITRKGNAQRFQSALLVRGRILEPVELDAKLEREAVPGWFRVDSASCCL